MKENPENYKLSLGDRQSKIVKKTGICEMPVFQLSK